MTIRPDAGRERLWWAAATLPLPLAALFVYVANEWLFFATKPSTLSVLPFREQVAALFTGGGTFAGGLVVAQLVATGIAVLSLRTRWVAALPTGIVLGCLFLVAIDNFTHTVLGFSSVRSAPALQHGYLFLFLFLCGLAARAVARRLMRASEKRRFVPLLAVWLLALPAGITAAVEHSTPVVARYAAVRRAAASPGATSPNVLLLATDGVPAERTSAYGYEHPTTPFLDSIRDQTLFCENAFSNVDSTHGSLVALLTGKLPTRTKVLYPPLAFTGAAARQHFPGILRARGYRALQLSLRLYADASGANLIGAFDLANYRWERFLGGGTGNGLHVGGADAFRDEMADRIETRMLHIWGMQKAGDIFAAMTGADLNSELWGDERRINALRWFIDTTPEPWLAHVHLIDTHEGATPLAGAERVGRDNFDVNVRAADRWFQTVFEALEKKGQLDRTIIVISSDHGRRWETRERLPLMIRFPGGAHARREWRNVQSVDVAPTILDYLGEPIPDWMDGVSLLRPQELREARPVFAIGSPRTESGGREARWSTRPPNYGAGSATVVLGSRWVKVDLADGKTTAGEVAGHTAAGRLPVTATDARRVLVEELTRNGFVLGPLPDDQR